MNSIIPADYKSRREKLLPYAASPFDFSFCWDFFYSPFVVKIELVFDDFFDFFCQIIDYRNTN